MKNAAFYNSVTYRERQAEITRNNWQKGIYDFLTREEKRQCTNYDCKKWFTANQADPKKFCSQKCSAIINNPKRSNISSTLKEQIAKLYRNGLSMQEVSYKLGLKYGKVVYQLRKLNIPRRSVSEANYIKYNPSGDPFKIKQHLTEKEVALKGLGLGLYWGEGNKTSRNAVRLGNSDPKLIKSFREFLVKICGVKKEKLKYSLLLFNDAKKEKAVSFWNRELKLTPGQIRSVVSLKPRGKGTYKNKSMTGVLMIEVYNTKLKKEVDKMIQELWL